VSNDFPANEPPATSSKFRRLSTVARVMVVMGAVLVVGLIVWFIS